MMDISELEKRLNSELNAINTFGKVEVREFTNRPGVKKLSEDTQELVGTLAHFERQEDVAKTFKISQARVSMIKNGLNGSSGEGQFDGELDKKVKDNVKSIRDKVSDLALGKLEKVIGSMTDSKIEEASLVQLSVVASNLGKLSRVEDSGEKRETNNFVFYAPRNKNEDAYEIIDVA